MTTLFIISAGLFVLALLYLAYRLFKPAEKGCGQPRFKLVTLL